MDLKLLGLAVAPGLAIVIYIYWRDKFDKEPLHLLAISFLLGCFSILPAILIEWYVIKWMGLSTKGTFGQVIGFAITVALAEEFSKLVFLLKYPYRHKGFNEPYDGITYSVMVGMGFATLENILYVYRGGYDTALLRIFTAVPAHATFGVLMGYYVGLAKFNNNSLLYKIAGLFVAFLFHFAYDWFIFIGHSLYISIGAAASLLAGIWFSYRAIKIHKHDSPFNNERI